MEPEEDLIPEDTKASIWTTVTPFSKYLALFMFITLPLIGGWIGYIYALEKVVEVEKIVTKEVGQKVEKDNRTGIAADDGVSVKTFRVESFDKNRGGYGELTVSPNGNKTYFLKMPYEGFCCSYISYYRDIGEDNGFTNVKEFDSITDAGLVRQHIWPVSEDGSQLAFTTFSDNAPKLCAVGMDNLPERAQHIVRVIDLDSSDVVTVANADASDYYQNLSWDSDGNLTAIKMRSNLGEDGCLNVDFDTEGEEVEFIL